MNTLDRLLHLQRSDGHFAARVRVDGREVDDGNATVTALTLRSLRGRGRTALRSGAAGRPPGAPRRSPRLHRAESRALDALERCELPGMPGAFGFWPRGAEPGWFPGTLPPDLDDTARATTELLRAGRRDARRLRAPVAHLAVISRAPAPPGARPGWFVPGAFGTWVPEDGRCAEPGGIVDLVVNANVLALLHALDLRRLPGFREGVELVGRGTAWALANPGRATLVTPWYAHPWALRDAVTHAARSGVTELAGPAGALARVPWARRPPGAAPLCRIAYGALVWESEAPGVAARARRGVRRSRAPRPATGSAPR